MNNLQIVGNLGADAVVKNENGKQFVSFKVADSQRWTDANGEIHETTLWIGCALSGDGGNLLQYLRKGTMVFVEGRMKTRIYSSEKARAMVAGVDLQVRHVELLGGRPDDIPSRLFTPSGKMVDISKHYWTQDAEVYGQTLYDKSMKPFAIDANGWVTRIESNAPAAEEATGEQTDAPFEGEADAEVTELQKKMSASKRNKK